MAVAGKAKASKVKQKVAAKAKLKPAMKAKPSAKAKRRADPYTLDLDKNAANYQSLSPLTFLERAAFTFPDHTAILHGEQKITYREFYARCRRLASALSKRGIGLGDTVAVIAPNIPPMLDAHYGPLMIGAVLNAINYRLSAQEVAFILDHGEAKVLIVDKEFGALAREALKLCKAKPYVIGIDDPEYDGGALIGEIEYDDFLKGGDPNFVWSLPADEWQAITLNYTSGTTGNPKGVVFHSRGAYLLAMGNVISASIRAHPVYLWSLPMFHCNGWCFTWTISVVAGTHVCLRRVNAANMFEACARYGVTRTDRDGDAGQCQRRGTQDAEDARRVHDGGRPSSGGDAGEDGGCGLSGASRLWVDRDLWTCRRERVA
jgi:fatty-acyl-CoA synthase